MATFIKAVSNPTCLIKEFSRPGSHIDGDLMWKVTRAPCMAALGYSLFTVHHDLIKNICYISTRLIRDAIYHKRGDKNRICHLQYLNHHDNDCTSGINAVLKSIYLTICCSVIATPTLVLQ